MTIDLSRKMALHVATQFPPTLSRVMSLIEETGDVEAVMFGTIDFLAARISAYDRAWKAHPLHHEFLQEMPHQPHNPYVVGVYRHPPGRLNRRFSYMIGDLQSVASRAQYEWGLKKLGEFAGIEPIDPEMPFSSCRVLIISNSLITNDSRAYESRMALKAWLPRKLHRLVQKPRRYSKVTKKQYVERYALGFAPDGGAWRKDQYPPEFLELTKAELWVKYVLSDEERAALSEWIDPLVFYHAATGKYHPEQIADLINPDKRMIQLPLPLL